MVVYYGNELERGSECAGNSFLVGISYAVSVIVVSFVWSLPPLEENWGFFFNFEYYKP